MVSFNSIMRNIRKANDINDIVFLATHWLFDPRPKKHIQRYARFCAYLKYGKVLKIKNWK